MILRRAVWEQRWIAAVTVLMANASMAGVWGTDPVVGVTGDYASNPVLAAGPHTGEADAALLLDVPTTYNADEFKFSILPSFRLTSTGGYSTLISDYEHLNLKSEIDTERSTLVLTVGATRDSNLFYNYLSDGNVGVRRDAALADLSLDRFITERVEFTADASATRVRYGDTEGISTLVDYKYFSVSPQLAWNGSEKNKYTLTTSVGRYNSLSGATESRNGNIQLGFVRQLSEQWSLTATGGYSRALNQIEANEAFIVYTIDGPVIVFAPASAESSQNGSVYSVDVTHHGKLVLFEATASRQVLPTGFAFLSLQQMYELKATYTLSPRWTVGADLRLVDYRNPEGNGLFYSTRVPSASISASWLWSEHWTLSFMAAHVRESVPTSLFNEQSQEFSLTLSWRFNHINYQ
jgi:hypothetical protein